MTDKLLNSNEMKPKINEGGSEQSRLSGKKVRQEKKAKSGDWSIRGE